MPVMLKNIFQHVYSDVRPRWNERGIAAITAAITLLVVVGMAAIAVDGSNLYRERGDSQNAADLSAMAAAYEECIGGTESDAIAAGEAQALANGFDDASSDVTVSVAKEGGNWRATIDSTIDGFFSGMVGMGTLDTGATALAQCTTSVVSGYALFAGGTCGQETLDWSGSTNVVTGDVHSNDGMDMSGSSNTVNGNTTTVGSVQDGGGGNTFNPPETEGVPWQAWPVMFDASDFLPGGAVETAVGSANYHYTSNKIDSGELSSQGWISGSTLDDGVYVTPDDIDLSDSNLTGNVTFVSVDPDEGKGVISLSGSDHNLTPYYQNLLVFSDSWKDGESYGYQTPPLSDPPSCTDPAVKLSGSNHSWTGIIYAPRGMVELSGSSNTTIDGSIVSYSIRLNGSVQSITFSGAGGGGNPITTLVE